ncbi:hypothetical protein KGF54_000508 [Candida jiufengensis]|uniref:uncharacterized protein n=1 Tax=Candida jiufengensis TaxID=497108 RepID=UPI0022247F8F|nr:uncharacterized protein KGF54_000508 [Candida jiufengensis]KAI5956890.1 hypothetical protein KGF54_000508 [Candida jiufengensis]
MTTTVQQQPSIQTITNIIKNYEQEINDLNLPNLITISSNQTTKASPYIPKLKLQLIQSSLLQQLSSLQNHQRNKNYKSLKSKIESLLIDLIDEKLYITNKLIDIYNSQNSPSSSIEITTTNPQPEQILKQRNSSIAETDNLTELRKRLLSTPSKKLTTTTTESQNDYHESIQEDIINELSQLTSTLKQSALNLSTKILGADLQVINETNENLIKNSTFLKSIENNLKNYLGNKSGNKISIWFLIKMSVVIVVVFIVMVLFIGIVPRIR